MRLFAAAIAAAALAGAVVLSGSATPSAAAVGGPNVVLILTDDQASHELAAMPQTQALITAQGSRFSRFYSTYPLCCPARATLLTGQYMHNHQVRGNEPPFGGHGRFVTLGVEARSLPTWLKAVGYNTAHVGKYLNGYPGDGNLVVPPAWDEWFGQVSAYDENQFGGKLYYDYDLLEKEIGGGAVLQHYGFGEADYETDVLRDKALGAIERLGDEAALGSDQPFYLELAVHAPHFPFVPAPRHTGLMRGAPLAPLPGVNEARIGDKPRYLRQTGQINPDTLNRLAIARRARMEQLLAVDEAVAAIVAKLAAAGELANTYIIVTSDNGYFFGEHRVASGKYLPYEPASRVPFVIRGPGIPAGATSDALTANVDVAPTIAAIANAVPQIGMNWDGRSLLPFAVDPQARSKRPVLLEGDIGAGVGPGDGSPALSAARRTRRLGLAGLRGPLDLEQEGAPTRAAIIGESGPAYRAIRTNRYLLVAYASGELELYDMLKDPAQLRSMAKSPRYRRVRKVLLRRLLALANCQADGCQVNHRRDPKPVKRAKRKKKPAR